MDKTIEQTVMCRTRLGEFSLVQFWRNGVYYPFPVSMETLQEVKLFVAATADDPNQNLTHDDELAIIDALHDLVFSPERLTKTFEPSFTHELIHEEPANLEWMGAFFVASCIFWILIAYAAVTVFN